MAFCLASVGAPAGDWPRLGGPGGTFVSMETGLARAWPTNGPRLLWTVEVGRGFAGPAVQDGRVYLLDRLSNRLDVIRCLSLHTGAEQWRWAYEAPGTLPYDGSRNVPTVDGERLYCVGPFGHFSCLETQSGKRIWAKHLINDFKNPQIDRDEPPASRTDKLARAQVPTWGVTQVPLVYGDLVIVAPQTEKVGLVAYDKATGQIRWQSGYIGRNWFSHVSPGLMNLGGVEQVIMLAQPSDPEKSPEQAPPAIISAVAPRTGQVLWTAQTPGPHKIPVPQPLQIGEDRVFVTGGYGMGCLMLQVARTNDRWSTRVLFHNKTVAAHIHSPVWYRDRIYVSSIPGQGGTHTGLVCLDQAGQFLWKTGSALQLHDGAMLFADGLALAVNGRTGQLHLLEISPAGYQMLASAKVIEGSNLWAPLALSDEKLLVRDHQRLKCLDMRQP